MISALLQAQRGACQPSRDMRLIQFQAPHLEGPHLGLESGNGGGVIDLNAFDPTLPKTMMQFLEQGEATLSVARKALTAQLPVLPRSQLTFLAPVTRSDKVVCVGMNYADHCKEQNVRVPKEPIIFSKFASSIVGPYDEIVLPPESKVSAPDTWAPRLSARLICLEEPSVIQWHTTPKLEGAIQ